MIAAVLSRAIVSTIVRGAPKWAGRARSQNSIGPRL
jgi:hypothetical protein